MHSKPTRKDMNAIDDPQHPPKPLPDAHPLKRCGKAEAIRGDDWTCCLTAGHRGACLPSKPMRPRGAGSEVRWIHGCHTDKSDQFIPMPKYGITDENAPRVLRAIYEDPEEPATFTARGAALIVAVCTVGACVLLVALAYVTVGW